MSNFLADKSYLAVKPQSAATTPVIPTTFIALVSESIRVNPSYMADRRLKGLDWKSDELLKGPRKIEGDLTIYADPDALGHMLNMTYAKGSTSGSAGDGYTHPFTPGDGKSYSLEISRGAFAQRIYGARADNLKIDFQDNKMVATVSVKALGQFYTASLGLALSGSVTTLVFSTDYDLRPTDGLVVNDVIRLVKDSGTVDLTILTINADGKTITFASTSITAAAGNAIFLLAQTPSYGTQLEPFYMGNTLVGVGATSSAADTAAAARTTATPSYNVVTNFKNNLLDAPASGATGPSVLLNQVKEADLELHTLFADPTLYQKWLENVKQAVTMITTGRFIKTDLTTSELLTVKYHKVKTMTDEEPLDVGQYIFDKQKYEALYDSGDAKSIEISLVNRTAGTAY
jgi:hypothetical protein